MLGEGGTGSCQSVIGGVALETRRTSAMARIWSEVSRRGSVFFGEDGEVFGAVEIEAASMRFLWGVQLLCCCNRCSAFFSLSSASKRIFRELVNRLGIGWLDRTEIQQFFGKMLSEKPNVVNHCRLSLSWRLLSLPFASFTFLVVTYCAMMLVCTVFKFGIKVYEVSIGKEDECREEGEVDAECVSGIRIGDV
ncbi:hypothetical protein PIB30_046879 [Stylosanthes scabra]|uniref:Transmembrane protein n=1 Tax=Stylosanthes scabra TaxID=79078 RepID=A0ABU6SH76_9FABA|nr:hypothetical protein [Stylosanthes scabra]